SIAARILVFMRITMPTRPGPASQPGRPGADRQGAGGSCRDPGARAYRARFPRPARRGLPGQPGGAMRRAILTLPLLAACSGEKTQEQPGKGNEQQQDKKPPCCTGQPEPWTWQDPTGPGSLGVAASVRVDGSRVLVGTYHDVLISQDGGATWNPSARLNQGRE